MPSYSDLNTILIDIQKSILSLLTLIEKGTLLPPSSRFLPVSWYCSIISFQKIGIRGNELIRKTTFFLLLDVFLHYHFSLLSRYLFWADALGR